jgi:hypothetical protein
VIDFFADLIPRFLDYKIYSIRHGESYLWMIVAALLIPVAGFFQTLRRAKRKAEIKSADKEKIEQRKSLFASAYTSDREGVSTTISALVTLHSKGRYRLELVISKNDVRTVSVKLLRDWDQLDDYLRQHSNLRVSDLYEQ